MENELIFKETLLKKIQYRIAKHGIVGETIRDTVELTRKINQEEPTAEPAEMVRYILGFDFDFDRLRELAEADKDGRIQIHQCTLGTTVYEVTRMTNREAMASGVPKKKSFGREIKRAEWLPYTVHEKKMSKSMYPKWGKSIFHDKKTADEIAEMWNKTEDDYRRELHGEKL